LFDHLPTDINISPKGLPSTTLTVFSPNHVAYIDTTGSGCETISHVYENGRVTIMFCSFDMSPRIMRWFCKGRVVEWDSKEFEPLLKRMGKRRIDGARAIIALDVFKVETSFSNFPSSSIPISMERIEGSFDGMISAKPHADTAFPSWLRNPFSQTTRARQKVP